MAIYIRTSMKHFILRLSAVILSCVFTSCFRKDDSDFLHKEGNIKLLIDSDMVQSFDDGMALMMMFASDNVEVLGLTTVTGNTWSQQGLTYGIRQGEIAGGKNTKYIAGSRVPLREGRIETLNQEIDSNPGHDSEWRGAISFEEITDWRNYYIETYKETPKYSAYDMDASEFIAQQIIQNPGEVTILAIGPCTNIAKALKEYPDIAPLVKEIIYMGGAVYCEGNTTPYAELNVLYDPEAAAICMRSPFPRQTLVSLDVCNTVEMDRSIFFGIYNSIVSDSFKEVIRNQYYYQTYINQPTTKHLVWDLISAALVVDYDLITEYKDVLIDVDDNPSSSTYGKTFVSTDIRRQTVRVPLKIDTNRFWEVVESRLSKY